MAVVSLDTETDKTADVRPFGLNHRRLMDVPKTDKSCCFRTLATDVEREDDQSVCDDGSLRPTRTIGSHRYPCGAITTSADGLRACVLYSGSETVRNNRGNSKFFRCIVSNNPNERIRALGGQPKRCPTSSSGSIVL